MQLIEAFVGNPVKVAVGVLLVALFGTIGLLRMPMQLTPEVQVPTITISTRWPGASPQEVEREIIQEQEEQLQSVEGVIKMSSESLDSLGRVVLEFAVGTNMDQALVKTNGRLQQVPEYPQEADEPVLTTSSSTDRAIAWFILTTRSPTHEEIAEFLKQHPELADIVAPVQRAHNSGLAMLRLRHLAREHPALEELLPEDIDVPKLRRFVEDFIEARFERVAGVADSNVLGGREEELQVVVDPELLAARQLTIDDLRQALRNHNKDTSGGDLWEGKRRLVIRTLGQFRSLQQVEAVIIARRDGAPVYVRDVAEVRLGHKKPTGVVRRFGTSAIAVNVQRETGANVLDVMRGLREVNRDLNEHLLGPRGLELIQVYDETDYIYSAVGLVTENIWIAGGLTVIVLLMFLRSGRSTLVIGLAIPVSVIGTFLMLDIMGRSLNVVSLAGLAFAVGMLVDNAVVVLENIYRHYQLGEPPFTAAIRGAQEVWGAVVASTLTTLAVFLPVLFVEQEVGQLFRDIALAICSAVALSLVVSVTVIPTAAARLLKRRGADPPQPTDDEIGEPLDRADRSTAMAWLTRPLDRIGLGFVGGVLAINQWIQQGVARRLALIVLLVGLSFGLIYLLRPKVEYLPMGNRNLVIGIFLPPPGYNLDTLVEMGETLEAALKPNWDVDPDSDEARALEYPAIGDFFYVARNRQVFFGCRAHDPLEASRLPPLIQQVGSQLPGTIVIAKQTSLFESGLAAGRTVDIEITGPELSRLVELGRQIMEKVGKSVPGGRAFPRPSLDLSSPEIHIVPLWEQAADMGVDASSLGYSVDALIDGAYATDYYIGGDKIDLSIIGHERYSRRTQDLAALPIATPSGKLVHLEALADIRLSSGPEQVNHLERQRTITIQVTPPPTMALEDAVERITADIVEPLRASGQLDGGYRLQLGGTADKLKQAWVALRWNLLLALLITYLLMAALFESWLYPLVIIFSVPLGAVGGFIGLWLLNFYRPQPLDVLTMLGFVILIGTVVNNAILIVHQSLNYMRAQGMTPRAAINESVRTRIRPIFMTTSTTVLGLAPLVFRPGAGSELYRGLGSVVLGGLIVSAFFTLFLVPTLFSLTMESKGGLSRLWHRLNPRARPPEQTEPARLHAG